MLARARIMSMTAPAWGSGMARAQAAQAQLLFRAVGTAGAARILAPRQHDDARRAGTGGRRSADDGLAGAHAGNPALLEGQDQGRGVKARRSRHRRDVTNHAPVGMTK